MVWRLQFLSPVIQSKNDLGTGISSHFKVVIYLSILFWGLPQIALTGYSGVPRDILLTRTLFPVRCKSCFTLLFLAKPYHFDTFSFLIYIVSKLVYPFCTHTYSLYKFLLSYFSFINSPYMHIFSAPNTFCKYDKNSPSTGTVINNTRRFLGREQHT